MKQMEGSTPAQFSPGLPVCSHVFFPNFFTSGVLFQEVLLAQMLRENPKQRGTTEEVIVPVRTKWGEILAAVYRECV